MSETKRKPRMVECIIDKETRELQIKAHTTKYTQSLFTAPLDVSIPVERLPELLKLCNNSKIQITYKGEQ